MIISFSISLIIRALGQKKLPLFPEMWVTRKIFTRAAANLFLIDFLEIFSFLLYFLFLFLILVFWFVCLMFLIKCIFWFTFDYAGGWVIKKFSPGQKTTFFLPLLKRENQVSTMKSSLLLLLRKKVLNVLFNFNYFNLFSGNVPFMDKPGS